jgi:hypothetical protein
MKHDPDKTDWTAILITLIVCVTILLSGAKCTYHPAPPSVSTNAR